MAPGNQMDPGNPRPQDDPKAPESAAAPDDPTPQDTRGTAEDTRTLDQVLPLVARGKVRDIYEIDSKTLLLVATDRISAFDVVLENDIPHKGDILNVIAARWFWWLQGKVPSLRTHFVCVDLPDGIPEHLRPPLRHRSMVVKRMKVFPIEAIVRGYLAGSAWQEYKVHGTVNGLEMPAGMVESQALPGGPIYTPSTKGAVGEKDVNLHPSQVRDIIDQKYAEQIERIALNLYSTGSDEALKKKVILADTKFEFGLDEETDEVVLIDEIFTPDSSRFWPVETYKAGKPMPSFDKQYVRDWLIKNKLKGVKGVTLPEDVVKKTQEKYAQAFQFMLSMTPEEYFASDLWEYSLGKSVPVDFNFPEDLRGSLAQPGAKNPPLPRGHPAANTREE
ncbi:MAG: Bifunctional purine biosynthetic protein ade1 [Thelocarpon superellum]|nr:MAG: Bifunctional purine biosynthetic protein ade1 [Thelocarpon superellum]